MLLFLLLILYQFKHVYIFVYFILQFSLQDNGSAKYFQGAMHTPNMGEKVAQVSKYFHIAIGNVNRSYKV